MCCVCVLAVRGKLFELRKRGQCNTHTHTHRYIHTDTHTGWEPLAWPFPPLPSSLYQHTGTNKLIHTAAPSNKLLPLLAQPTQSPPPHTLIATHLPVSPILRPKQKPLNHSTNLTTLKKVKCDFLTSKIVHVHNLTSNQQIKVTDS